MPRLRVKLRKWQSYDPLRSHHAWHHLPEANYFGRCLTPNVRPLILVTSFKNTRMTGVVPFGETGAITCTTFHSLLCRLMILPMRGVSIVPLTSSSTSCTT